MAAVFVIVGAFSLVYPMEGYLFHPTESGGGVGFPPATNTGELLTKGKSRIYGGIVIAMGLGIGWLALRRETEKW